ncbi:ABC transporter-related protein [Chthoniobacter flavus Ellin428]|uniref:ABC transporter-related protein n=1 Tax=Chthoniobacter flavus Ellin428 TaxID=497964 RepID=B4D1Y1_9BACT|nr:ABC transporter ATP-binding protein [Chthoniobacter flavus]EDY19743.1 ABC transporter-related protein [Chthoniobacter flavus Ellin428]TCO92978.1 ATP-binding cassette subfamily B protein/subfamily B ATP-binding cassette protein MsbA [Chthoniobacter flavus]
MSFYRRVLTYFRPDLRPTVVCMGLTLVANAFNLLRPWPLKYIVDKILPAAGHTPHGLTLPGIDISTWSISAVVALVCGLMVVFHLLAGGIGYVINVLTIRVGLHGLMRLRTELYAYLHSLPLKFHDQRRSADSSFRVAYDSQSVQAYYSKGFFLFQSAISLVSTFAMMWYFDWSIALLSLIAIPLMMLAIFIYAKRIRDESTTVAERESDVLTAAQEGLSSVKMVQAFGREEHEVQEFSTSARESLDANLKLNATSMRSALLVGTIIAASSAAMCYVGALHVLSGKLTIGGIWYLSSLLLMLYQPLEALTHIAWAFQAAAAGTQRCFEILDKENDVADAPDAVPITSALGEIVFENVAFGYSSAREILHDVNLRISPGETVAFVGGTGAGKSTLLSLVPRFYDPTGGSVLLDGKDLRALKKKSLRDQISIVLQDTLLFSTTIRENIAYGRPDATEEEIIEAAKRAQAHEFIMATPDGYRSQVGERGGHLSVGQRQRIGIARAFLKNAPLLILDEPTSALDPTTESAIMQTIEELMRGRTTLIITHRIATVHRVNKIVVLAKGTIAEEGKGPELVQRGGVYASLYRSANLT